MYWSQPHNNSWCGYSFIHQAKWFGRYIESKDNDTCFDNDMIFLWSKMIFSSTCQLHMMFGRGIKSSVEFVNSKRRNQFFGRMGVFSSDSIKTNTGMSTISLSTITCSDLTLWFWNKPLHILYFCFGIWFTSLTEILWL